MDATTVRVALVDWRTAPLREPVRAMLGFLEKQANAPTELTPEDLKPLRAAGLSDEAIQEALYVAFMFHMINRLADAFDFPAPDFDRMSGFLYRFGYSTGSIPN